MNSRPGRSARARPVAGAAARGPSEAREDRAVGTAEPPGRGGGRQPLEMAEHQGFSISVRQPRDLLVQGRPAFRRLPLGLGPRGREVSALPLVEPAAPPPRSAPDATPAAPPRRANWPPNRASGSIRPAATRPGTWPGRHPGHRPDRPAPDGRRASPSAPCRSTRTVKAASAAAASASRNCSRSWPSVDPPTTPRWNRVRTSLSRTASLGSLVIATALLSSPRLIVRDVRRLFPISWAISTVGDPAHLSGISLQSGKLAYPARPERGVPYRRTTSPDAAGRELPIGEGRHADHLAGPVQRCTHPPARAAVPPRHGRRADRGRAAGRFVRSRTTRRPSRP